MVSIGILVTFVTEVKLKPKVMQKLFVCCIGCLLGLLLNGCHSADLWGNNLILESEQPIIESTIQDSEITWALPPMIMVEGELYQDIGFPKHNIAVKDNQILGYISTVVSIADWPKQDGEANYDILGAPYARWSDDDNPDAIIVYHDHAWYLCVKADRLSS